jgi:Uma2 family endonuclease
MVSKISPTLKYLEPLDWLPTAEDLANYTQNPGRSELEDRIPNLLSLLLADIFAGRSDWFFGIDMALYYSPDEPPIVPDGFLSIGVDRVKAENLRLSYVLWEEKGILPQLAIEVVSKKYRGEYSTKKAFYQTLGIPYYVIYNPRRRVKPTLEIYQLVNGQYIQMVGNRVWIPEIGLGIGKETLTYQEHHREWLFWYNEAGDRYPTPQERADKECQRADQQQDRADRAEQQLQRLADRLRALGIDPDKG